MSLKDIIENNPAIWTLGLSLPGAFSAIPATAGQMVAASLSAASVDVGGHALSALHAAAADAPMAAERVSLYLPSLSVPVAFEPLPSDEVEPLAYEPSPSASEVDFAPSLIEDYSPVPQSRAANGPTLNKPIAALALAFDSDAFFASAKARNTLFFRINVSVAVIMSGLGLIGIGGCLFAALFSQTALWAPVLGGVGVANWLGFFVYKPLDRIKAAVNASTRLDLLFFRLRQQLGSCAQHAALESRIQCQTKVWEAIQREAMAYDTARSLSATDKSKADEST